ncbi:MAG: S1C family serine protease [Phycisphaerae bacterium]
MDTTQQRNPRIAWLVGILALLAFVALGIPSRMLTQWAYAVERGRLQASSEELVAVNQDLARVQEVSQAFRLVAKVARPSVVHIRVSADETAHERFVELNREQAELREQLDRARRRIHSDAPQKPSAEEIIRLYHRLREIAGELEVLAERLSPASGSGIIFDQDGHILTNSHVVVGRHEIGVRLPDEREYEAALIGSDPQTDLALLKIDAPNLHPLKFGDSDRLEVGDWVIAVGAPFGLSQSVTHGIISATGRNYIRRLAERGILYQDFLQTDAAINPGNSGGPLLNLQGEVIGVNTAIATNGDSYNAGIAFTIPSNMAVKIANQLKEAGEVARGWLGITMGELTAADREILGIEGRRGVLVASIIERAPADKAGLLVEDAILTVNGQTVANMAELRGAIADISPGDNAMLDLLHDGEPAEITVKLDRRPPDLESTRITSRSRGGRELPGLGLYARTLLPSIATGFGHSEEDRGVLVSEAPRIWEGIPLPRVVACNGEAVRTLKQLEQRLSSIAKEKTIEFELVDPDGERRTVKFTRP